MANKKFESNAVFNGEVETTKLKVTAVGGDEGGEILFGKPATNTTIAGTGVTVDVFQNKLRFFEQGGDARGYYLDITGGGAGVTTNIIGGGSASDSFKTISVTGQSSVVADSSTDTLSLIAGTNVSITTDATADSITINSTGAYTSVDSITYPDYITFDTTPETVPTATGSIFWDDGDGLPATVLNANVTIGLGQEQVALSKNATGASIAKGKVVYINGAAGQRPTIALSDADSEATSSKTFGLTAEAIANGAEGFVATFGVLRGVNTLGLTEGAALWLSSTAGSYTTTVPAEPAHSVFLGYVVKAHATAGEIFVNIQNGYELTELHGVIIDGTPADNEVLAYDSTSGLWINQTASEAGIATVTGTETLTNKTLTTPKINEDVTLTATSTELNVLDGITASTAELNYVDGVTSAIQTQLEAKAPLASPTITGTANINNLTISSGAQATSTITGALVIDGGIGLNGNIYAGGNLVLTGNLTVNGSTTTLNTATLDVEDNIITVNSGITGSPTLNGGLEINRGTSNDVSILWNETYDYWTMTNDGTNYLPLSQQTTIYLNNATGSTIPALTPVYVSSVDVSTNTSYMSPVASTGNPAIGITRGSVSTGSGGWVITSGMIEEIDTSSLADVTYYYVSATGTLTTTAPATEIQKLLFCIKSSATVGKLYVLPSSGERTSYQAYDADLTSIAALTANGILRKTAGTWDMDTGTYLTSAVTSITAGTGLSGGTITSTGTIALATAYGDTTNPYASKTANYVLASPTGTAGVPTFRALLAADIPALGNITNAGAIGSTANLVAVTTTSGVLTTATATNQSATTFLRGDLSWVTPTDTNFYPTAFAWTNGTTSGPTGSLTGTGMSAVSYAAVPSANDTTTSGIVTTTTQTFGGAKTFSSNITVPGIATSVTSGTFALVNTGLTGTLNIGGAVTGNINIGSSSSTTVIAGNLTVSGTTTTIDATTLNVDDINIELGTVASPTDTTASGGGITLKGATDKIISWATTAGTGNTNTGYWTSTENLNLSGTSKAYFINGVSVLSASTLGSGITASSLTSLGSLSSLVIDTVHFDTFSTSVFTNANGTTIQNVAAETVSYRTAEYIVQCTDTAGAKYRSSKIMVLLTSATTAQITEYAILESSANALPITFTATAATSFVTLKGQFSSAPTNTVTIKVIRIGMT